MVDRAGIAFPEHCGLKKVLRRLTAMTSWEQLDDFDCIFDLETGN